MVKLRTTLFFVGSLLQVTKLSPTPQVVGVKYLRLYAPSESRHLYPREVAQLHQGSPSSWRVTQLLAGRVVHVFRGGWLNPHLWEDVASDAGSIIQAALWKSLHSET
jgi:hypothetical protein